MSLDHLSGFIKSKIDFLDDPHWHYEVFATCNWCRLHAFKENATLLSAAGHDTTEINKIMTEMEDSLRNLREAFKVANAKFRQQGILVTGGIGGDTGVDTRDQHRCTSQGRQTGRARQI